MEQLPPGAVTLVETVDDVGKLSPRDPGRALIAPGEDTPADLKVGEAVNRATGERNTRLGGGQVLTPVPPSRNPR